MVRLHDWAEANARKEGFYIAGSIAQRYNNPGNLVFGELAKAYGATTFYQHPKTGHKFAIFPTLEQGWAALEKLLENAAKGKTSNYTPEMDLVQFYTKYSPIRDAKGNIIPNVGYAKFVADFLKVPITTKIKDLIMEKPAIYIENQLDPKFSRWYIGKVKTSKFKDFGCFLFCWSYLYSVKMGKQISPTVVDGIFVKNGVYNGDLIDSVKAAKALGMQYVGKEKNINNPPNWHPTIKEVDFSIKGGAQQHFVVRTQKDGKNVILDPYGGVERKINYYEELTKAPNWENGHFSYRAIKL